MHGPDGYGAYGGMGMMNPMMGGMMNPMMMGGGGMMPYGGVSVVSRLARSLSFDI